MDSQRTRMSGSNWRATPLGVGLLAVTSCVGVHNPRAEGGDRWPLAVLDSVDLHDVFFLDAGLGWAVGDHGVIWRTKDGGIHWHRLQTYCDAGLCSVHFVDGQHGWAVGSRTRPYSLESVGVVLRTRDGGQTWDQISVVLPGLRWVRFQDQNVGWTLGMGDWLFPAGIFRTHDGGLHWRPVGTTEDGPWLTGLINSRGGLSGALHADGTVATAEFALRSRVTPARDGRQPRHLQSNRQGFAMLAGDSGLVRCSSDGGRTWMDCAPAGLGIEQVDLRAVAFTGAQRWVAGSPGTCVFASHDQGSTWRAHATGDYRPIHALHFVDDQRGWAVGGQGLKLATLDGGRTWSAQSAPNRVGALAVFEDVAAIPWEALAEYASHGHIVRVQQINGQRRGDGFFGTAARADRLHEASLAVGAAGAVGPAGVARATHGGKFEFRTTTEATVRAIRTWRPEILITGDAGLVDADSRENEGKGIASAIQSAGDPTAYREHVAIGLTPWVPQRAVVVSDRGTSTVRKIWTTKIVIPFGATLAELGGAARRLLFSEPPPAPPSWAYQIVDLARFHDPASFRREAATMPPGRRFLSAGSPPVGASLRHALQLRRSMDALVRTQQAEPGDSTRELQHVLALAAELEDATAGHALFRLALRLRDVGRIAAANEILQAVINLYPQHDCVYAAARMWLRHQGSFEWQRMASQTQPEARLASHTEDSARPAIAFEARIPSGMQRNLLAAGRDVKTVSGGTDSLHSFDVLAHVQKQLPRLAADPRIQLHVGQILRLRGELEESRKQFLKLAAVQPRSLCNAYAEAELWLQRREGGIPLQAVHCQLGLRPHLDGVLDEVCWQSNSSVVEPSNMNWPARLSGNTKVRFARDHEFLFVGIECARVWQDRAAAGARLPRQRDTDLSRRDRVELCIDTDRDYATHWTLVLDERGWGNDRFAGYEKWNPEWYIAPRKTPHGWFCEVAIRLGELAGQPPSGAEPWAIRITRRLPTTSGWLSWPTRQEAHAEDAFGWLLFE